MQAELVAEMRGLLRVAIDFQRQAPAATSKSATTGKRSESTGQAWSWCAARASAARPRKQVWKSESFFLRPSRAQRVMAPVSASKKPPNWQEKALDLDHITI